MNAVSIIGTLTKKPILKKGSEKTFTSFTIAVNDYRKGEKTTMFFDVVAFGKNAETICTYLDKGYTLPLTGRLHQSSYKNKDGKTVSSVCISLESFTLVTNKVTKDEKGGGENDFKPF